MSTFNEADARLAQMHGYEPVERICSRCHEPIIGPALLRAGKMKAEMLCGTCKDKERP